MVQAALFGSVIALLAGHAQADDPVFAGVVFVNDGQVRLEEEYPLDKCAMAVRDIAWSANPRTEGKFEAVMNSAHRQPDVLGTCTREKAVYLITATQIVTAPPPSFSM